MSPEEMARLEHAICGETTETAYLFDRGLHLILTKPGGTSEVEFTAREIAQMSGGLLLHNHPSGESFSRTDLHLAILSNLAEMRVVGKLSDGQRVCYCLKGPRFGWREGQLLPVIASYQELWAEVLAEFRQQISDGILLPSEAGTRHAHEVLLRLSAKYPSVVRYGRRAI